MKHTPNLPAGTRSDSIGPSRAPDSQNGVMTLHGLPEAFFAPMPAVTRILSQFDRRKLGAAIEVMIALLDVADGDEHLEEDDPAEIDDEPEDGDTDCCSAGDDRGGLGGPASYYAHGREYDEEDEMSLQPLTLNPG